MPGGKPAGVACVQLDAQFGCRIFGRPERPAVCVQLRPRRDMCGDTRAQAIAILDHLERATTPVPPR